MARAVINGKVMRAPSLTGYDNRKPRADVEVATPLSTTGEYNQAFLKDAPSTRPRDKALLVALGVDGDVPLAQARVNAGLSAPGQTGESGPEMIAPLSANDNELAVKAA